MGKVSGSAVSEAHIDKSFACNFQSPLNSWVLDNGASRHITGNKALFSSLTIYGYLPSVVSANGSEVQSQGIGIWHCPTVQILPSLSITFFLYLTGCSFNFYKSIDSFT